MPSKPLDNYEKEMMQIFNCQHDSWPICLYDFTYKNRIPECLVFRASKNPPRMIYDYFYTKKSNPVVEEKKAHFSNKDSEGLLIERGEHFCYKKPNFVECFKILYE